MIRLPVEPLGPDARWALALLVDLARLLPVADPAANVVALRVDTTDEGTTAISARPDWRIRVEDGAVVVPMSTLRAVVALAGAGVEQASEARDRHDRVPATENPLVAAGAEREPIVHAAARALRDAVVAAAGTRPVGLVAPWPDGRRWAAALTHDLDVVSWWPLFTGLRAVELGRKGHVARVARVAGAALAAVARDPVWRAARDLVAMEREAGAPATWFALCGTPTPGTFARGDLTYLPESRGARRILDAAREAGNEVGLHGSFATMLDAKAFRAERERLASLAGMDVAGVRQHFLRMRPGATHAAMREAGFRYDATFGFSDRNGFRLGVADVVPVWDAAAGQGHEDFDLVPLAWMDRALSKYRGVEEPDAWVDDALALAARVREVEGLWVGLWHPNLVPALGYPDAPAAWRRLVHDLVARAAWIAPLRDVVAWRRARRSAVALRVAPDGRPVLARGADAGVSLEDAAGRPLTRASA